MYLVVALLLMLAVAGLLWLKASREPEPAAAPVAATPAAAAPPPTAEPPPPPPPIEEPEEPEPEPEKAAPEAKAAAPRNTACSGECAGEATAEVRQTLRGKAGQARSCYNRALSQNSALSGKLLVGVRIGPAGQVCSASLVSDTLGDDSVSRCVLQRFRAGPYPKPTGGCVDVQVPISFTVAE
jgi:hypothetical protein